MQMLVSFQKNMKYNYKFTQVGFRGEVVNREIFHWSGMEVVLNFWEII